MLDVNYSEGARIEILRFRQLDSRLCYVRRTGIDFSVVFGTSNSYLTQKLPRNILARGRIAIAITITSFGLSKLHKNGGGRNAGESEARRECARENGAGKRKSNRLRRAARGDRESGRNEEGRDRGSEARRPTRRAPSSRLKMRKTTTQRERRARRSRCSHSLPPSFSLSFSFAVTSE